VDVSSRRLAVQNPRRVAPLPFFPRDQGRDEAKGATAAITGIRESFIRVAEMKYAPASYATGLYDMYPRGPLHKLKYSCEAEKIDVLFRVYSVYAERL
jgi:hypothetical protein